MKVIKSKSIKPTKFKELYTGTMFTTDSKPSALVYMKTSIANGFNTVGLETGYFHTMDNEQEVTIFNGTLVEDGAMDSYLPLYQQMSPNKV